MGFFSSAANAISSGISTVGNFISSGISSIGGAISGFAKAIIAPFPQLIMAETAIKVIVTVISFIAQALNIIKKEETPEEIGAKAMECGRSPEEFKSTEEYIEYLRNEVQLDKEKFENMSQVEKLGCTAVGVAILTRGIEEKEKISIPVEFLHQVAKVNMKSEEVKCYIESFKNNGLANMGDMVSFLKGDFTNIKVESVSSAILEALKSLNPDLSEQDIQAKIYNMKLTSRKDEGM